MSKDWLKKMQAGILRGRWSAVALLPALAGGTAALAQTPQSGYKYSPGPAFSSANTLQLPKIPVTTPITPNANVVEDVIARVNDQIITRTEYERAQQQLLQDAEQHHMSEAELSEAQGNLLRDMIDKQLLLSKGKELGISGDAETIRELDEIRKQNHMNTIEDLEKAASQQGVSFEDFKQQIKNQAITQQVVRDEVGRHINMSPTQEQAYYAAHEKDFVQPEQVHLSEILIPTAETATEAQLAAAQSKADAVEAKLKGGANFAELAKSSSGGPTANAGGDLGDFKHGVLGDVLEKATFDLPQGGFTEPIRTRQGFVILRVDSHQAAGVPPLKSVEPQVQEAIYLNALQPALRAYLTKRRTEASVDVKPGFVDAGAPRGEGKLLFSSYTPPPPKKKTVKHQQAELKKAEAAQAALSAEREKAAEKASQRAAAQAGRQGGVQNASRPAKPPKVHREKIRYGQAPRNALPTTGVATTAEVSAPIQGQAAGVAMASSQPTATTFSSGTGPDADASPLGAPVVATHKTRFSQRQPEENEQHAEQKVAKAEVKASIRPAAATAQESSDEKQQAAPLGLNGSTAAKTKIKRAPGATKERLQEKAKPAEPAPPAATVNPALGAAAVPGTGSGAVQANPPADPAVDGKSATANPAKSADRTTLPPVDTGAPGAPIAGQPIPATTSAQPGAPATVPPPH